MVLGPPIVGMPHPAMAGPASVVQAMWGNLTVLGPFKAFSIGSLYRAYIGLIWEGTGKTLVGLCQGTAKSPWVDYGPRPPYCGDAPSSHGRPSYRGAGYVG